MINSAVSASEWHAGPGEERRAMGGPKKASAEKTKREVERNSDDKEERKADG